jgi:hypothetical protein
MFRRAIYRPKGARTLERARELVGTLNALVERGPWTLKKRGPATGGLNPASPNGRAPDAQSVASEAKDLVAPSVPEELEAERVATPCFVIFAPSSPLPRSERSVSNEGGLVRFGLDSRDDRPSTGK